MSAKRRDNKGRVLRDGESFRSDGRYMYRYTDRGGERRTIYSYRLVKTDKIPDGKRAVEPLRDMEERILRDEMDGINSHKAENTKLNEMFDDYISSKYELKRTSKCAYNYRWDKYVRYRIGNRNIGSIRYSDIKKFYSSLIRDFSLGRNSINNIQVVLHPVFNMAIRDGLIRNNPTDGVMAEIKKGHAWATGKRHALTEAQQARFLSFIASSNRFRRWLNLFKVLLGTGGRVGEIIGLRWDDCDFDAGIISINHNLVYAPLNDGKMIFSITTPKTRNSTRIIPMFSEVKKALLAEKDFQNVFGPNKCSIDGYHGFVFMNRSHKMLTCRGVDSIICSIVKAANLDPHAERLPQFSVHNLRHTFCTRLCEYEPNIKIVQEIMGHDNIATTMDIYNEATEDKKIESFSKLDGLISLGY